MSTGKSGLGIVQKVAVRSCASLCDDMKTLSTNPAVNGYFFEL